MKLFKRSLILFIVFSIVTISILPIYGSSMGTYEYNDYNLYSVSGTRYSSGAFRSNNTSMSTFVLTVNVNNNTWSITGGTTQNIPFPNGISIDYTDRTTFLQSAYYTVNGNRYTFTMVSADDTSGNFYSHSITTSGYPVVNVYLPTTGTSQMVPTTPILSTTSVNGNSDFITWSPSSGYFAEVYRSDSSALAGTLVSSNAQPPFECSEDGYYYVRLKYSVDGVTNYTDYSNRIYVEAIDNSGTGDEEENNWQKLLRFFDNIVTGLQNATSTLGRFISTLREFITTIFSWLPEELTAVFIAILVVGLVIGLFLK